MSLSRDPATRPVQKPIERNAGSFSQEHTNVGTRVVPMTGLEVRNVSPGNAYSRCQLSDSQTSPLPGSAKSCAARLAGSVGYILHSPHAYLGITSYPSMPTRNASESHVTKFRVTGEFDHAEPGDVSNFRDRLLWAIKFRDTNQLQLANKAGLSPAHVNRILKRAEQRPDAQRHSKTVNKLAKALDISLLWLETGDGPRYPYEPYLDPDDPFPNRQVAARAHLLIGTDSRAIHDAFARDWGDTDDPAAKVWFKRIEAAEEQLMRGN